MSTLEPIAGSEPRKHSIYVWDPLVRLIHWSLVVTFTLAYLTGDEESQLHEAAGYAVLGLVLLRMAWGFIGTKHARFRDFVYRPHMVLAYADRVLRGRARRYIGHNPLGGVMILLMLASLSATSITGWLLLEPADTYAAVTQGVIANASADSEDDGREIGNDARDSRDEALEEAHEFLANFTLLLVALHIAGVLLGSYMHQENLIAAMISGRKRP